MCTFAPAFKGRESLETVKSDAEIAQLVEHDLAKVGVASSSLVFRSKQNASLKVGVFVLIETRTKRPRAPRGGSRRQAAGGNVKIAECPRGARARVSFSAQVEGFREIWSLFRLLHSSESPPEGL